MRRRLAKLERMERDMARVNEERRWSTRRLLAGLADRNPDLELVEPCDTDPSTYRDIQQNLAMVRGDWDTHDHLSREAQEERRRANPNPPALSSDPCIAKALEAARWVPGKPNLRAKAIAAAKKRLAKVQPPSRKKRVFAEDEL